MAKPWEEEWTTRQTRQGTWVMADEGHGFGPESRAVMHVYLPEAREVTGDSTKERMGNAEALALSRARLASKAPKMARALMSLIEAFPPAGSEEEDEALEFARKALREAGVLE